MQLGISDIHKLARLARISIDAQEAGDTLRQLSGILHLITTMQNVNTTGITPMSHPQDLTQRLRSDVVTETNQRDALQKNAPATHQGLYLVPQVLE